MSSFKDRIELLTIALGRGVVEAIRRASLEELASLQGRSPRTKRAKREAAAEPVLPRRPGRPRKVDPGVLRQAVLAYVREHPGASGEAIRKAQKISKHQWLDTIGALIETKGVGKAGRGSGTRYWSYEETPTERELKESAASLPVLPRRRRGRPRKCSPDVLRQAILGYVREHPGARGEAIRKAEKISKHQWLETIGALLEMKEVRKLGLKGATRYWSYDHTDGPAERELAQRNEARKARLLAFLGENPGAKGAALKEAVEPDLGEVPWRRWVNAWLHERCIRKEGAKSGTRYWVA
jgi:hypothetical protein